MSISRYYAQVGFRVLSMGKMEEATEVEINVNFTRVYGQDRTSWHVCENAQPLIARIEKGNIQDNCEFQFSISSLLTTENGAEIIFSFYKRTKDGRMLLNRALDYHSGDNLMNIQHELQFEDDDKKRVLKYQLQMLQAFADTSCSYLILDNVLVNQQDLPALPLSRRSLVDSFRFVLRTNALKSSAVTRALDLRNGKQLHFSDSELIVPVLMQNASGAQDAVAFASIELEARFLTSVDKTSFPFYQMQFNEIERLDAIHSQTVPFFLRFSPFRLSPPAIAMLDLLYLIERIANDKQRLLAVLDKEEEPLISVDRLRKLDVAELKTKYEQLICEGLVESIIAGDGSLVDMKLIEEIRDLLVDKLKDKNLFTQVDYNEFSNEYQKPRCAIQFYLYKTLLLKQEPGQATDSQSQLIVKLRHNFQQSKFSVRSNTLPLKFLLRFQDQLQLTLGHVFACVWAVKLIDEKGNQKQNPFPYLVQYQILDNNVSDTAFKFNCYGATSQAGQQKLNYDDVVNIQQINEGRQGNTYNVTYGYQLDTDFSRMQQNKIELLRKQPCLLRMYGDQVLDSAQILSLTDEDRYQYFRKILDNSDHYNLRITLCDQFSLKVEAYTIISLQQFIKIIQEGETLFDLETDSKGYLVLLATPCGIVEKARQQFRAYKPFNPNQTVDQGLAGQTKLSMREVNDSLVSIVPGQDAPIEPSIFVSLVNSVAKQSMLRMTTVQPEKQSALVRSQASELDEFNYESQQDLKQKIVQQNTEMRKLQQQIQIQQDAFLKQGLNVLEPDTPVQPNVRKLIGQYLNTELPPEIDTNQEVAEYILHQFGTKEAAYAAIRMSGDLLKVQAEESRKQRGKGADAGQLEKELVVQEQEKLIQGMEAQIVKLLEMQQQQTKGFLKPISMNRRPPSSVLKQPEQPVNYQPGVSFLDREIQKALKK